MRAIRGILDTTVAQFEHLSAGVFGYRRVAITN